MTIQPIGATSMALYITPNDLKEHGLTPDQLTLERALDLTQTAFRQAGVALEGALEIEAYPDSLGVLVFAHVHPPERVWFSFGELEEVLAAARALPEPRPEADLLWWEGRYWLCLPAEERHAIARLWEFGQEEPPRCQLEARLAEHARPVLQGNALTALLSYFPI